VILFSSLQGIQVFRDSESDSLNESSDLKDGFGFIGDRVFGNFDSEVIVDGSDGRAGLPNDDGVVSG